MNYRMIGRSVGNLLLVEAACMLPSLLISLIYPESDEAFEKCGMRNAKCEMAGSDTGWESA